MLLQNPLEAFSNPTADYPILRVLEKVEDPLTTTAIFKRCPSVPRITVHKSLTRLVGHGIVNRELLGNAYFYSLNRNHILFPVIKELVHVTDNLFEKIRESISTWENSPDLVYLFGSAARGQMTIDSDLDLLFVLENETCEKDSLLNDTYALCEFLREVTGNEINPVVFYRYEIKNTPLFRDILEEGVCIYGDSELLSTYARYRSR